MLELNVIKGLFLGGMFLITLIFSLLPLGFIIISRRRLNSALGRQWKRIVSLCSCFGGGVFLATGLLDLFPDVNHQINHAFEKLEVRATFPVPEFVMVFGFLIILVVEQIVLSCKETGVSNSDMQPTQPILSQNNSYLSYGSIPDIKGITSNPQSDFDESIVSNTEQNEDDHNHWEHSIHQDPESHSPLRSILLLLAISLHAIFEGLAVGLQTATNQLVQIFAALVVHKCIIAFSLGINLAQSRLTRYVIFKSNLLFSLTSPVGIGIGMGITGSGDSDKSELVGGILQGIACGTFLYVTFFEILPHELNKKKDRLLKVLVLILGFGTMCILINFIPGNT